jgi:hypothetical protein
MRHGTHPAGLLDEVGCWYSVGVGPSVVIIGFKFSPFLLFFCPLPLLAEFAGAFIFVPFLAGLIADFLLLSAPFIIAQKKLSDSEGSCDRANGASLFK